MKTIKDKQLLVGADFVLVGFKPDEWNARL